jgi:hypothetical protein
MRARSLSSEGSSLNAMLCIEVRVTSAALASLCPCHCAVAADYLCVVRCTLECTVCRRPPSHWVLCCLTLELNGVLLCRLTPLVGEG